MDRTDLMDGFPVPPPDRPLPHHAQQREEMLALVRATERGGRVPVKDRRRWLVPLAAAAAVLAIVVPLSLAGSHLLDSSPGPGTGPQTGGIGPAGTGGTGPAQASDPGVKYTPGTASFARSEWHRTDSVTARGPLRSLNVKADVGTITVTGTDGSTASVTERLSYRGHPPQLNNHLTGGQLALGYTCRSSDCGVDYTVQVPRGVTVTVHTDTGAIRLSNLAGQVVATADTGSVTGTALSSASAVLTSNVGSVTAAFTTAPRTVRATTDTGSVTIRVPASGTYAVSASSDVGTVRVTVPRDQASADAITARSDVGSVTIASS